MSIGEKPANRLVISFHQGEISKAIDQLAIADMMIDHNKKLIDISREAIQYELGLIAENAEYEPIHGGQ